MRIACSLVLTCGLAGATPALAQDGSTEFEYSPVARLVHAGQFRAEVWRREIVTDRSDLAWSDTELSPTAAKAAAEACAALQRNFDPNFSCAPAPHQESVSEAAKPQVVSKALASPAIVHNAHKVDHEHNKVKVVAKVPVYPPPATEEPPVAASEKGTWLRDFWKNQDRYRGGSGGGP
jgi:hypothetical protein